MAAEGAPPPVFPGMRFLAILAFFDHFGAIFGLFGGRSIPGWGLAGARGIEPAGRWRVRDM